MAQRLVRTLCLECRAPYDPPRDDVPADFPYEDWLSGGQTIYRAVGCRACRNTGYSGRIGIYELLEATDRIRQLAIERSSTSVIKRAAVEDGMRTLRQDGWRKVLQGRTSIDEVLRVAKAD
jgi:general secretion pathway protein E/type IV pilus assembly protein PilB